MQALHGNRLFSWNVLATPYFRRKANAGDAWTTFHTLTRADLNGLPLQVGIWQANFNANVRFVNFDNFSITGPNVGAAATPGTLIYG